jgi:RNA-directed DNA polymerase
VVKRKTSRSRLSRGLRSLKEWFRKNRHDELAAQHQTLCQKLRAIFGYYGITGNSVALSKYRWLTIRLWRQCLLRQRRNGSTASHRFTRLLERYPLPQPIPIHPGCRPGARS